MAENQWSGKGPNGEKVFLAKDKLIVVESMNGDQVRVGYFCENNTTRRQGGKLSRGIDKLSSQLGPYLYLHVEIPEAERKPIKKEELQRWASSQDVPPPFCLWPEEFQLSVAQWIVSISGPEEIVSHLSVKEVSLHHIFLSGFFILLNVPEGVEV